MFDWFAGKLAGYNRKDGYLSIGIDCCEYLGHRLAWLWMTGKWPECEVDHRNTNPANNSWHNLRKATVPENRSNQKISSSNSSGFKGVCFNKLRGKWMAYIDHRKRRIHLGYYNTAEVAAEAYNAASKKYHKEFGRVA
jgi:HNH endonuclease/AP2 domain